MTTNIGASNILPFIGLSLQVILLLFVTVLNGIRTSWMIHGSLLPVAIGEFAIGVCSFVFGILGYYQTKHTTLSILVVLIGLFISLLFVFVYLLPEAGDPPIIQ